MGLGLTISRDLVKAFGGNIKIASELGKGTDFIISLNTKCKISLDDYSKSFKKKASLNSARRASYRQYNNSSNNNSNEMDRSYESLHFRKQNPKKNSK